jgi:SAM-dependent methyltransferase
LKKNLQRSGFKRELIQANVRGLKKLVSKLRWKRQDSEWSSYMETHSYDDQDHERKQEFVARCAARGRRHLVWDIGCNTGAFSMIAAESAEHVVACDFDHLTVDRLYRELHRRGDRKILPLLTNIVDPSPALGWRGSERKALTQRGKPDLILALALIHHIVIGANVPMVEFLDWLAEQTDDLVIEFVSKDDPMVKKLLLNKADHYADYEQEYFENTLSERFEIREKLALESGTRLLYFASSRRT